MPVGWHGVGNAPGGRVEQILREAVARSSPAGYHPRLPREFFWGSEVNGIVALDGSARTEPCRAAGYHWSGRSEPESLSLRP
jgi:hypothetical protein